MFVRRTFLSSVTFIGVVFVLQWHINDAYNFDEPNNFQNAGARSVIRIYDECSKIDGGFSSCLKKKAIAFIDRISNVDAITIVEGVKVIRSPEATITRPLSENDLELSLPRALTDRDSKLTSMLIDRVTHFLNGHTVQVIFPKITPDEIGRGIEEGRGKMKKMVGMMMMGMAMKMVGMIPVAMGALYMLAGKALIISKIALLLAGMMGIKKLMSGKSNGGGSPPPWSSGSGSNGGGGGGWSSGGGSGGWDRRALTDATDLPYRGYNQQKKS